MVDGTLTARQPDRPGESAGKPKPAAKPPSLQDSFLNALRRGKHPLTIFLVKGVKLQGIVTWFDNFSILLRNGGQTQLVYKHAISTISPEESPELNTPSAGTDHRQRVLQEVFLQRVQGSETPVTMFLVNGVMLQGRLASYDQFSILLRRDGAVQLVYKHAISTVQPEGPIDLHEGAEEPGR